MKNKRPWSRSEKALLFTPLLLVLVSGAVWWKKRWPLAIATSTPNVITFSPDGRHLAVLTRRTKYVYSNAGSIYNSRTGTREAQIQVPLVATSLNNLAWSPDNSRLAMGFTDFKRGTYKYKYQGKVERNYLASVGIWNAVSGAQESTFPAAPANEYAWTYVDWGQDGKLWGTCLPPSLFDVESGKRIRRFGPVAEASSSQGCFFNPSHTLLALTQSRGGVLIYEIPSGRLLRRLPTPQSARVVWSSDEDVLAVLWDDPWKKDTVRSGKFMLVDARTGRQLPKPPVVHPDSLQLGRKGKVVLVETHWRILNEGGMMTAESSRVLIWDYHKAKLQWQAESQGYDNDHFDSLLLSPNGKYVYVGEGFVYRKTWTKQATVWDMQTGQQIWRNSGQPTLMTWSPDSKRLAFYQDGHIQVHSLME